MMDTRAMLAALRVGQTPSKETISEFVKGVADGDVSSAQAAAFAMSVCIHGLSDHGRVALTLAMRDSGDRLNWDLPGPVLDKHSTGGVGDCVSLVLAPALAACGAYVPMISGRGLGHTGGTLDKLEAIPGICVDLAERDFRRVVQEAGCAIVSATADIAPADRKLYAIRDVTATVESIDLITASILSKKLATGLDGLVLDVKVGTGAFMKTRSEAEELARALVSTANAAGCPTHAVISDMNQPLASALGNAVEVAETMLVLNGQNEGPLAELSCYLGGMLLADVGLAENIEDGKARIRFALQSGLAAERFGRMVAVMGGPFDFVTNWQQYLPKASVTWDVTTEQSGFVNSIDGEALGLAVVELGGGRMIETDQVDHAVGLTNVLRLGKEIEAGATLARVHAVDNASAARAAEVVRSAVKITRMPAEIPPLIHTYIGGS